MNHHKKVHSLVFILTQPIFVQVGLAADVLEVFDVAFFEEHRLQVLNLL